MIYLELFLGFLQVGCFAFGGAYAAIPLIRDVVLANGWMTDEMLSYMIAVSESTPGPIMVNLATYVGVSQAGILGAIVATTAVVLPSFIIVILITAILNKVIKHPVVNALLRGFKPSIIGIVAATGCYMMIANCITTEGALSFDLVAALTTAGLCAVYFASKKFMKKGLSPIGLIVVSAIAGIAVLGIV